MFIEIEDTPNPNTTKFIITENILKDNKTYYYPSQEHAVNSPLGLKLFEIEEVSSVFLGANFLSVSVNTLVALWLVTMTLSYCKYLRGR